MQVFRLMDRPDRVIAFDELPERLCIGFEKLPAVGFPRHWKQWMGKKVKITNVPPERDPLTGQARRFDPIVEEDCFFYVVDAMLQPQVEKWQEICDFVKQHVSKEVRLMDRIEDMSKHLAPDQLSAISLEPEEVTVIPIPLEYQEKDGAPAPKEDAKLNELVEQCQEKGCTAEYTGKYAKNAIRLHMSRGHKKEKIMA